MSRQTTEWPQMPAAYAFPRSSKLSGEEAEKQRALVEAAVSRGTLTQVQERLVLGTLLGDGHITPGGSYVVSHGWPQREYLWHKHTILREFVYGRPSLSKKNKLGKRSVRFWTASAPAFRSLRRIWYPDGVKRVTAAALEQIDQAGFIECAAWWIADDGTRYGRLDSPTLMLCTNGFTLDEVKLLADWVTDHGFPCKPYRVKRQSGAVQSMLYLRTWAAVRLMEAVEEFTPPVMRYKLRVTGRNDAATCMFCTSPFRLKTLVRRTDLPTYPCCGSEACRLASARMQRKAYDSSPRVVQRKRERRRERLRTDPQARERHRLQNRLWAKTHPDKVREHKRRYLTKMRAMQQAAMPMCFICGKRQELEPHARADRSVCRSCQPELARRIAKRNYWRRKLRQSDGEQADGLLQKLLEAEQSLPSRLRKLST